MTWLDKRILGMLIIVRDMMQGFANAILDGTEVVISWQRNDYWKTTNLC
jgi:hypothetical protein